MRVQEVFKAIADPSRRKVLKLLQGGSRTAGELAEAFAITKGSLSHHFNVLKAADLIRYERRGQQIVYSLNTTVFQDAAALLLDLFGVENGKETADEAQSRQPAQPGPRRRLVRRRRRPLSQTT
jgi:DNA-binding transcriptional ArsR family regulator